MPFYYKLMRSHRNLTLVDINYPMGKSVLLYAVFLKVVEPLIDIEDLV